MKKVSAIIIILSATLALLFIFTGCDSKAPTPSVEDILSTDEWTLLNVQKEIQKEVNPKIVSYWNQKTGKIVKLEENEITLSIEVPVGAEYVGYSVWGGYLFLHNTKAYAIFQPLADKAIILISKNVISVTDCNAYLTSDAWSNPLFIMSDGSLKGYIPWHHELVDYPVDESKLYN